MAESRLDSISNRSNLCVYAGYGCEFYTDKTFRFETRAYTQQKTRLENRAFLFQLNIRHRHSGCAT